MLDGGRGASSDLLELPSGIRTSLPTTDREADYDRIAAGYDLIVGNGIYNRLVWGCPKSAYHDATKRFLRKCDGARLLDFGCGSLVFTACAYRPDAHRLTLFDRSLGMLERAKTRLPDGHFVQGDAFDPPFAPHSFDGAMSWGMLHVFGTGSGFLEHLAKLLKPGAPVAISTLVRSERWIGNRMLTMLHARGEASEPESAEAMREAFGDVFEVRESELKGSMLFLSGAKRADDVAG